MPLNWAGLMKGSHINLNSETPKHKNVASYNGDNYDADTKRERKAQIKTKQRGMEIEKEIETEGKGRERVDEKERGL